MIEFDREGQGRAGQASRGWIDCSGFLKVKAIACICQVESEIGTHE